MGHLRVISEESEHGGGEDRADHLKSLRDGRAVYIDGGQINDVTAHPAFRNSVQVVASLYDYQAHPDSGR